MKRIEGWVDCLVYMFLGELGLRGLHRFENGLELYSTLISSLNPSHFQTA